MSQTTLEAVFAQAQQLSPQDRLWLIEHLAATLQAEVTPRSDWHQFLHETYGSLRDTPIQRWDQGEYEAREPLE